MSSLASHIHLSWSATLVAFIFFSLVHASADQDLGGEEGRAAARWSPYDRILSQRKLTGPGSSPPTCKSKCGSCSPCERVAGRPALRTSLPDYYPIVWKCKCGDKIFPP